MPEAYRHKFVGERAAVKYDTVNYAPGTKSDLLWQVESELLERLVREMRRVHQRVDYLDFACGTGRILSFLERSVDRATGIDVSPAMLKRAAAKVNGATLLCRDITADGAEVEGRYDLISCFRFLKNAEPALRLGALRQLARRLRSPASLLVVNVHGGNPFSYRALLLPYHWLRALLTRQKFGDYLSNREVRSILAQAGLRVERVIGYSFISGHLLKFLPFSRALSMERRLVGVPLLQALGANQLFLCRLARPQMPRPGVVEAPSNRHPRAAPPASRSTRGSWRAS
jgi:SAM-dependent methyltransferase